MAEQLDIFSPGVIKTESMRREDRAGKRVRKSIDQRFAEFHTANPHVFAELLRLARAKVTAGATRIGLKALWEELRASLIRIADGGGPDSGGLEYKLNNDFTALYARMLVRAAPELEPVIEMRRRKRGA